MLRFAALLAIFAAAVASLQADLNPESGAFLFKKYTPVDYAANQQNWAIVQDRSGLIYVANTDGILEFDGVSWRKILLPRQAGVVSLAIDSRGIVFAGGQGLFGYLAPDPHGALQFVSLLDKVAKSDRSFNEVWDVLPTSDGVYFVSDKRLFLYTSGADLRTFRPLASETFDRAFAFHDELFVASTKRGLLTIRGNELIRSGVRSDPKLVRQTVLFANGEFPILASGEKLYRFSLGSIDPFPSAADSYLKEHKIYSVRQIPGGDIAVGTSNGGLVLLSQKGEIERILRKSDGLPSDWITSVLASRQSGIWLATDSGLTAFDTRLTGMEERQGIHGNVFSVARLNGALYVGTALGLFRMRTAARNAPLFEPVFHIQDMVLDVEEHAGFLFVGTSHGLFVTSGDTARKIREHVIYGVGFSPRDPGIVYTAGREGVLMLKRNGSEWAVVNSFPRPGAEGDFRSVVEAPDGRLWATTRDTIWRIDFSSQPAKTERFDAASGVPPSWKYADAFRNHVVFATTKGLLQFSDAERRFLPDAELGTRFADGKLAVSNVKEDAGHNVWITGRGYHGVVHGTEWFGNPMLAAGLGELYSLQLDPDGTAWAAGDSGQLFRYAPASNHRNEFRILLRGAILTNEEQLMFGGYGTAPPPRLPYRDNALRLEYAAPFPEDQAAVDYQFRLDGSEKQWSPWTKEARKDYTNLPEGSYTFHVHARNPHGTETADATYQFTLLAPWYRTWWAYGIYIAAFLVAGWIILRWRLRALEARNRWLEGVVEQRTAEVRTERDQNEALLLNILPKPVASELRTTGSVKPTSFEDVTVCFSDFVGFTLSSEKLPPQELITSLNEYFTAFDEIIGRYGLEKLKTIGDAYMFAGGLPSASPSHAVDSVCAAIEMVDVVRRLARPDKGLNWSIRLGLYSGPVVAGVVGVRKFAFDIWGNTVNFAARMESAGVPNRVNLSETTCSRVFDFFECEPRGRVRIKEGRELEMFFAVRLRPELAGGPLIDGIPQAFRQRYEQSFSRVPRSYPNLNGNHDH